ncbi:MAG: hypothetical protein ABIS50_18370 [Luteolibacter sp.]
MAEKKLFYAAVIAVAIAFAAYWHFSKHEIADGKETPATIAAP